MDSIHKLTQIFTEFPGIGPRQAKRFVYFLLTRNKSYIQEFIELVKELEKEISICQDCQRYFTKNKSLGVRCEICASKTRPDTTLMIVSRDVDLENIEKSHSFDGKYFVLGGNVPILDKNPENKIRLKELVSLIEKKSQTGLKEIILGLNANTEGEYTGHYLIQALSPLVTKYDIKISHLGRGLSTGTELEYSDADTIKSALQNRN
ncbi:MAG: toprim domain-containing protein [bacterium]